ncbi:hypothetical protein AVEN_124650-1 [Araneus ventricosus]|uniref:RNase H type-1 domain-containing protein n=1 Tax=Araneus ventricosus TaxID=182803 RepID=A0A4Y2VKX2_ARAVE|nr:hypothetical protein AVEN_124650-1 [Araneus ventricosus]
MAKFGSCANKSQTNQPTSCSVFTAEIIAILFALKEISDRSQRYFIIYTDSLSVLQSLSSFYPHPHNHPLVLNVLDLFNKLALRGFNIMLCWVPSHVGIVGNEQADKAAKSAVAPMDMTIPVVDLKKHVKMLLYSKWQEQWDLETNNKLYAVKPFVRHWPSLTSREADTLLTRLRIGHTRFTHLHLLFGEEPPMCSRSHLLLYTLLCRLWLYKFIPDLLVTVYCFYLPPHDVVSQQDLENLVDQLPTPFILLGDLNGHSTLLGSDVTNSRGRQIEQFISNNCLCLLNNDEKTYFHEPTRTFHSLDLAICSPTLLLLLHFTVGSDLCNSDHFSIIVSYADSGGAIPYPPRYLFQRADWGNFMQLEDITESMVSTADITEAVQNVIECLINTANNTIPKFPHGSGNSVDRGGMKLVATVAGRKRNCGTFLEDIRRQTIMSLLSVPKPLLVAYAVVVRGNFGLILFRQSHPLLLVNSCGKKVKAANGIYREFSLF